MTNNQKLILLLEKEMIPDLEDYMDKLFEKIASKKSSKEDTDELEETRELHKDLKEILEDAKTGDMDENECGEIIDEIMELFDQEED